MSNVKKKFILVNLTHRDFKGWYSFITNIHEIETFTQLSYMCTIYIAKLNSLFKDLFISLSNRQKNEVDAFFVFEQTFVSKVKSYYVLYENSYIESFKRRELFKKLINRYAFREEYTFHQSIYFIDRLIGFSNFIEKVILSQKK